MTVFKGLKTGFNKTGSNDCCPNMTGPPDTKFSGRGGVPEGPLKRYPGAAANISNSNRRLAKSNHGDGGGSGTRFSGRRTAFNKSGTQEASIFYRPGGSATRINSQVDTVYADTIGGATGWLAVSKGNTISINVARASLVFQSAASSQITPSPVAPEVQVVMEMKMFGGDPNAAARPIDQWQNMVVATSRRAHRDGWVRLRVLNINNVDGTGVVMDMQISRTGDVGAST